MFFAILLTKLTKNRGSVSFVSSPCLAFVVFPGLDKFTGRGSSFRAEATGSPRGMRGVRGDDQESREACEGFAAAIGNSQGMSDCSQPQSETRGTCQGFAAAIGNPRDMSGCSRPRPGISRDMRGGRGRNRKPAGRPPPRIFMGGSCRRPHMGLSSCGKLC